MSKPPSVLGVQVSHEEPKAARRSGQQPVSQRPCHTGARETTQDHANGARHIVPSTAMYQNPPATAPRRCTSHANGNSSMDVWRSATPVARGRARQLPCKRAAPKLAIQRFPIETEDASGRGLVAVDRAQRLENMLALDGDERTTNPSVGTQRGRDLERFG